MKGCRFANRAGPLRGTPNIQRVKTGKINAHARTGFHFRFSPRCMGFSYFPIAARVPYYPSALTTPECAHHGERACPMRENVRFVCVSV